jgi:two-component system NarL family response regulator
MDSGSVEMDPKHTQVRRPADPIRVLLVDDHPLFRHGVRDLLTEQGFQVAEAASGEDALELAAKMVPHVVIMDLSMPGMGGVEATRRLTAGAPLARVLVLTLSDDEGSVVEAIMAGACGYLMKDSSLVEIASAVRAAHDGGSILSPNISAMLLDRLRIAEQKSRKPEDHGGGLADREVEVLRLLAQGKNNAQIAEELFVSPSTVKTHVSNILTKLQIGNRIQAAVYATRRGMS